MLKGEDIVVLLKLMEEPGEPTVRSLEVQTHIPRSVIHRSLGRLAEAKVLDARNRRVNVSRAEELLLHAVKYMFPPMRDGETRGVPHGLGRAAAKGPICADQGAAARLA